MLRNDAGEWRRVIKALVAGLDPAVEVLIGRADPTGHYPVRLTLEGCRETLRLYEDQAVALAADEPTRHGIQQELKETIVLLHLKAEIARALEQAHPKRRLTFAGPVALSGGEVAVEIKGGAGFPGLAVRARTYGEAIRHLHQQVVKDPPFHP